MDEHGLTEAEAAGDQQAVPGRRVVGGKGTGVAVAHAVRDSVAVGLGDDTPLREAAGAIAPDHADVRAHAVVTGKTGVAPAAVERGIDHHPITGGERGDARTSPGDVAGDVHPRDVGQGEMWKQRGPLTLQDVEPVQTGGPHGDEHLALSALGVGHVLHPDDIGGPVFVMDRGLHVMPRSNGRASAPGCRCRLAKNSMASRASRYGAEMSNSGLNW